MQKNKPIDKDKEKEKTTPTNADLEGNDKAPGEEQGKSEKVTNKDLKGKKVDANPNLKSDKPAN